MGFTSPCSIPRITRPIGKGYEWFCFIDPLGPFRSRLFRTSDIVNQATEPTCWTDGTAFLNLYTREIKIVRKGKVVDIMQIRCNDAWGLYISFCDLSEMIQDSTKAADPECQRAYMRALNALREHLKSCPACKRGINVAFSNSREHPTG